MLLLSFVACYGRPHLHFMKIIGPIRISWFLDIGIQRVIGTEDNSTAAACQQSLSFASEILTYSRKTLHDTSNISVNWACAACCHSFETRPNSPASGLSYDRRFINKRMLALEKPFWREKTRLTSQRPLDCSDFKAWSDSGRASFSQEIKTRLCSQGGTSNSTLRKRVIAWDPKLWRARIYGNYLGGRACKQTWRKAKWNISAGLKQLKIAKRKVELKGKKDMKMWSLGKTTNLSRRQTRGKHYICYPSLSK